MIPATANQIESASTARGSYGPFSTLALGQLNMLDQEHPNLPQQQQQHLLDEQAMDDQLIIPDVEEEQYLADTPAGSEPVELGANSGDDQDRRNCGKRKRNHRHTPEQIQRLEAVFKESPHPDDKQRKELGRELGLEPLQVKFWFQNKRTQLKNQNEREENQRLKEENDRLLSDNSRLKEALSSACCPNCGGPPPLGEISIDEQALQAENARLRDEIQRISAMVAKCAGQQLMPLPMPVGASPEPAALIGSGSGGDGEVVFRPGTFQPEFGRPTATALAQVALEELLAVAQLGEPIWTPSYTGFGEALNEEAYARAFPGGLGQKMPGLRTEASRETVTVPMDTGRLVDILMDANKWSTFFSSIVTRATTAELYSAGIGGGYDGALQLMTAELQVPTPLVPLREGLFLRYCKQHDQLWVVVDISMEVRSNPTIRYRRRPSGCIIQEMPDGYSKVIWLEHVEVDDSGIHNMYKSIVNSGLAFGARRWAATLTRQCERLASLMAIHNSTANVDANSDLMRSILKLAERMVVSFCSGVSGSVVHQWTNVPGTIANDVRIRNRKNNGDPGRPPGVVLSASTSIWLPIPPKRIFDFLRSEPSRNQWDILLKGAMIYEVASIVNGQQQGNCVSIFGVGLPEEENSMMILQESCCDTTCAYVIYAPVDAAVVNAVLNGGDPNYVALLPSGFAILPDGTSTTNDGSDDDANPGGSLMTVAFQILVDSGPDSRISFGSIATVNSLLSCTCDRIKAILLGNNVQ